jgi:nucleotide-binding universal stress UspA family protein
MNGTGTTRQGECVIVGVDGSETARVAAEAAAEFARRYERPLHLVMAVPRVAHDSATSGAEQFRVNTVELAEQQLLNLASELRGQPALSITTAVVVDDPSTALCNEARSLGASVVVVGNKRTQGVSRFLGSVAGGVVKAAPCAVHIVHTFD